MNYEKIVNFIKHKNFLFRAIILFLTLIPIFYFKDFYYHFYVYITGSIITNVITQQWHIVILIILLFIIFLIPLSFRRKVNWTEYGLVSAFFISLFVEMYGIPLTILLTSRFFFDTKAPLPNVLIDFNFLGVNFDMDLAMIYGSILMVIGMFLIIVGWITLYRNAKKKGLVMDGIYSYSRHPQYFGFILIVTGWLFGWPTILTIVFTPILIYNYIRLCKIEEKEISKQFSEYKKYKERVPFLI